MHLVRYAGLAAVAFLSIQAVNVSAADATVTLTVDAGPHAVAQGATVTVPVKVHFQVQNVVCAPGPSTATVTLAVVDPSPVTGITATLPASVVFDLAAPIAYAQTGPYNADGSKDQTVNLNITVAAGTIPNHDHSYNVTASFSQAGLTGCNYVPAATLDTADNKPVSLTTGSGGGSTPGGNNTTGPTGGETSEAAIALPLAIQVTALLALGLVVARRKLE